MEASHDDRSISRHRVDAGDGPQRDDVRKTHPCLVPFERLSEADKVCDRQVTRATLRAVQTLGFEIVKRD